jgi:hypothetical protein
LVVLVLEGLPRAFLDDLPEPIIQVAALGREHRKSTVDLEGEVLDGVHLEALKPEAVHEVTLGPLVLHSIGEGGERREIALDVGQ